MHHNSNEHQKTEADRQETNNQNKTQVMTQFGDMDMDKGQEQEHGTRALGTEH